MEPSPSRSRGAAAADPLAYLPAHLLDEILTRVSLRDAVRTSALSRAWRRRWESVPGLSLCFAEGTPPSVIGGVLLLYTAPRISRFACEVNDEFALSHVGHWLVALSHRSVQFISIELGINRFERELLHSSIFSCTRLVSLDLKWCGIPPLPVGFPGFPLLEELQLNHVKFLDYGERQLEAIIRGSSMLRVLTLDCVDNPVDCVIEAPNLHSLSVYSEYDYEDSCRLVELPCLQHAHIWVVRENGHDSAGFLAGVARVLDLTFYMLDVIAIDSIPFTFYNLRRLELFNPFYAMNQILLMFSLLRSSPNLEKLKIWFVKMHEPEIVADWEFLNAQWTDGMCANLQIVQIYSPRQCLPIFFLKLILSKASLLCTLSVDECPDSQDDPLNELSTCKRASAQAQVLFKD